MEAKVFNMLRLAANTTKTKATLYAFAAIRGDGSVITWGSQESGGDSRFSELV